MFIVGIVGGSGTGKSVVSSVLTELGILVFNCDEIYHELISHEKSLVKETIKTFGKDIVSNRNKGIDFRALAKIVFQDEDQRKKLNQITHPWIIKELIKRINDAKENGHDLIAIDAPLLYESGFDKNCDMTIGLIVPDEVRIKRIISRDNISEAEAKARISTEIQNSEIIKKVSVIIINNETGIGRLAENVKDTFQLINKKKLEKEKAKNV